MANTTDNTDDIQAKAEILLRAAGCFDVDSTEQNQTSASPTKLRVPGPKYGTEERALIIELLDGPRGLVGRALTGAYNKWAVDNQKIQRTHQSVQSVVKRHKKRVRNAAAGETKETQLGTQDTNDEQEAAEDQAQQGASKPADNSDQKDDSDENNNGAARTD